MTSIRRARTAAIVLVILGSGLAAAAAQDAETILVNGKILTVDAQSSVREALAVRDGVITAVGRNAEIRAMAGAKTRTIDLQGKTVIPGLIDSHMHATRAAGSFATEVNWIGASSLTDAINRLRAAATRVAPGAWLVVVTPPATLDTFPERRRPTQAELVAAAPSNPVYVQLAYGWAMMTPLAMKALNIRGDADLPKQNRLERDGSGQLTGGVTGNLVELFDRLPKPTFDQQVAGTKAFFYELNRLGITGVVDPGGNNMTPNEYQALFKVWRDGELTVRVAYSLCGMTDGKEFEEYKNYLAMMPQGFGDDMLHFNGIGERITWAMNSVGGKRPQADKDKYYEIVRWAAGRGLAVTMHWNGDENVDELLGIWERVNREFPIRPLRWTIAHLNDASPGTLQRMKALGVGWTVQDAMYNAGEEALDAAAAQRMPPVVTGHRIGVAIGAGTDAHRVSTYNPFTVLQWLLDGKTAAGVPLRGLEETPGRADALRFYTAGSAWVSHDDDIRGSLEVGKQADLAVLSKDYMTVPVDQIGGIESVLTMVAGKVVYAAGPAAEAPVGETPTAAQTTAMQSRVAQRRDPRFEAGVVVSAISLSEFAETDAGVGARVGWLPLSFVGVEAELMRYPRDYPDGVAFSRARNAALFGVTIGPRIERARPFARIRAGLTRFEEAPRPFACIRIFPPPLSCALASGHTAMSIDVGGGIELRTTARTFVRLDAGDLLLKYPGPVFARGTTRRMDAFFSHNLRVTAAGGVVF
jgi:predicted amidohydrolase YtcJ